MRQIFNGSSCLEYDDYALIIINNSVRCMAYRPIDSDVWSLLSIDRHFVGSTSIIDANEHHPLIGQFRYGWVCYDWRTIDNGLTDMSNSHGGTWEIVQEPMSPFEFFGIAQGEIESSDIQDMTVESFISEDYTDDSLYVGQHSYHYHHSEPMNTPKQSFSGHRIGIELEVEFNNRTYRNVFNEIKSNWFYRENDGSLDEYGCEIITIPLLPKHAKSVDFWKPLTDYLSGRASSWDTSTCGLHVHIGREILGKNEEQKSETIGKLLYLYHHHVKDTRMNIGIYGRERAYHDHDGKTDVGNAVKILGSVILKSKDIQKRVMDSMREKAREARYFDINMQNSHTIEFRKGRGSINAERIAMVVDYCERMCIYARTTPWTQISYDDFVKYLKATTSGKLLETINRLG